MANKYKHFARKAQEERRRERMCGRKTAYESRAAAETKGQEVYECPYCGKWHRTSKVSRLVAKLKRKEKRRG